MGRLIRRGPDPGRPAERLDTEPGLRAAYAAHGAELFRFALRQLGDEGAAEEVVQEVFLRAWRRADTYDPQIASLRSWLYAIARNAVVDESRRVAARPWRRTLTDSPQESRAAPVIDAADQAVVDAWVVEEALRRIRPEHREAIVATHLRGRAYAEVAAELGIPIGTLRSRIFYGMKALRLAMDEMGVEQ
ncbi:sigma-70 family RNA polymerase sigma factor [Pseudonocardia pini]|uniref:sigma-70 family RNA polymerase sigma factor n=1 Tax=Pseudonocardia pini TaxID=2758030 RepID=UPI0028AB353F|nr:sigma-70 family RNA polymerase sigma factor [Pseudonocardia pini]